MHHHLPHLKGMSLTPSLLFNVLKQHKHKEHDKTTCGLTTLCVFLCLPCHRVAQRLTTFRDILHGLHHCPFLLEPHNIFKFKKKKNMLLQNWTTHIYFCGHIGHHLLSSYGFFLNYFIDLPLWGSWTRGGLCGGDDDHMWKPQEDWLLTILFYFG